MAIHWLFGNVQNSQVLLFGNVVAQETSVFSYIQIIGPPFDYAAINSEYTPPSALAVYEGVDVSETLEITGTVNTAVLGVNYLQYSVPDTVPPLIYEYRVLVYDPDQLSTPSSDNNDHLVILDVISPVYATIH